MTGEAPQPERGAESGETRAAAREVERPRTSIEAAASLGLVMSIAAVGASVLRSKVTALFLGPEGVGVSAEVQQLAGLGLVPLAAFSGPALMRSLAADREAGTNRASVAAVSWVIFLGVAGSAATAAASPWLLPAAWSVGAIHLVGLACSGLVVSGITSVAIQTLVFEGRLAETTKLHLAATVVGAVLVATLTAVWGITGQFVALLVGPLVVLPWALRAARRSQFAANLGSGWDLNRSFFRSAFQLGAASLIAAAAMQGALTAIRWQLELSGGPALNGQFQAAWAIGSIYLGMVLSGIGSFTFPRYAAARDSTELQREVDAAARFVIRVAPPVVILAQAFSGVGVRLLYSARFDVAVEILNWQLAGDVVKCMSWVYAGPLLFRGKVRAFLLTELAAAGFLSGFTWLLVPIQGPAGAGQAYFLSYALYLPLVVLVARYSLEVRVWTAGVGAIAVVTAALALQATRAVTPASQLVACVISTTWAWRSGLIAIATERLAGKWRRIRSG